MAIPELGSPVHGRGGQQMDQPSVDSVTHTHRVKLRHTALAVPHYLLQSNPNLIVDGVDNLLFASLREWTGA